MKLFVSEILPNPEQPRKDFDQDALNELASSMGLHGLLNAVPVEGPYQDLQGKDFYFLVDGERRWRAAKQLGWESIEASIVEKKASNESALSRLMLALTANMQRQDMSPIEEAEAFRRLKGMGLSNVKIAHALSTNLTRIAARLRLLDLDGEIQELVHAGNLPADVRVTEALLSIPDVEARVKTARRVARPGVTIRVIQDACASVREALARESMVTELENPACEYGKHKYQVETKRALPGWDMAEAVGAVPPWAMVKQACMMTCDCCALREVASLKNCGDCPAVQVVKLMLVVVGGK